MRNARIMGLLPENADLPYSAIIGWADVVRCDEPGKNTSEIWAQNEFTGWVLENVHVFDEPILNVKGKLGIFDYPLEESELPPSHPAVFTDVKVENDFEKRYLSVSADKQMRTEQEENHDSSSKNEPTGMAASSATQQL